MENTSIQNIPTSQKIYDYVVIGSGFGGAISTCRLAEKGYDVCLLERGREWGMHTFPRRISEIRNNAFWDPEDKKFGMMEILDTPGSDAMTLTASGLGGGSLIYANVLKRMPAEYFQGWPQDVTREVLEPYYDEVVRMMEASPYPFDSEDYYSDTPKTREFKTQGLSLPTPADGIEAPRVSHPDIAVRFKGEFPGHQTKNIHGAIQSKCNKCGECDIGCNIHAKNTLDLNYITRAKNIESLTGAGKNAEIRTHSEVVKIEYINSVWLITFHDPTQSKAHLTIRSKNLILSAGSVGSTKLLLSMKKGGSLPNLNHNLGQKWCGNGDLLGFTWMTQKVVQSDMGPTITTAIDFKYKPYPDGFKHGFTLEDAGFPIGLSWYMSGKLPQSSGIVGTIKLVLRFAKDFLAKFIPLKSLQRNIGDTLSNALDAGNFTQRLFVLLAMGRDRSTGTLSLNSSNQINIKYNYNDSKLHYDRVRKQMDIISQKMGGTLVENPLTKLNKMVAVHPLGGCPMGESPNQGVVNSYGISFEYPSLRVLDGSIIPTSIGPNPSLTIAALTERSMASIPPKQV